MSSFFSSLMRKWYLLAFILLMATLFVTASGSYRVAADNETFVVQVSQPAGQQLDGITAVTQHSYNSFTWLELGTADFAKLQASGSDYQLIAEPFSLTLGEQRFDPLRQLPTFSGAWGTAVASNSNDLHLVQFSGPTKAEWLTALNNNGLEIVQYIHPHTYVVWGSQSQLQSASHLAAVRWTGPFLPAYRVLPQWQQLAASDIQVNILLYRGADSDAILAQLATLGGRNLGRSILNQTWEITGLILAGDQLLTAAQIPGIYSIQPIPTDGGLRGEMSNQINVNNHDNSNLAFPGYQNWLDAAGVDGSGVIIANVDGGIQDSHPDLVNRLIPCVGSSCGGAASSSHGTHTAAIMAGDGTSGITDAFGFLRGQGVAPGANLVEQVYSGYSAPGGMLLLMTQSYNNGASISGNSWGPAGSPQGYDNHTLQVDIGVRDADPDAAGNQPLNYVLSFMNGYGGNSSQGTPDEAKNIFTIGSTKMQTGSGSQILAINDLSGNSAHGPALDGRTIPHMVAPGCSVDSAIPTNSYGLMCGTSMASPHVAGAAALFIEYYRNLHGEDPSPAMVKAAFLPVAHDLAGYLDADGGVLGHPFDSKQGWGRMDLTAVVSPTQAILYFDNPLIFDNTGEEWSQTVSPADPSQPVRLMLVWTDAPGHGLGGSTPAWNNDLHLIVEADSDTYYGNNFNSSGWSQSGGSPDLRNNTEGIFLGPTPPNQLTIRVLANSINSDGIPNEGDETDQDFSLVCVNCSLGADFGLAATPTNLSVCMPNDAIYSVDVLSLGGYDAAINLAAIDNPAGTSVEFSQNDQPAPYTSTLTVGNTGAATAGSYPISVVGFGPTSTYTVSVNLHLFEAAPTAPTLLAPAHNSNNVPLIPTFQWGDVGATTYLLEVATDPAFTDIVIAQSVSGTSYTPSSALNGSSLYFWRVTAGNACGQSEASPAAWFATVTVTEFCSAPNLPINSGPHTDDLVISSGGELSDLNVSLDISHSWVGDLIVSLQHVDSGTTVVLVDQPGYPNVDSNFGCDDNNLVGFVLDDESANGPHDDSCPNIDATPAYPAGSAWNPIQPLSAFDGEALVGTWRLSIVDDYPAADPGILQQWCLLPTADMGENDLSLVQSANVAAAAPGDEISYTLVYSNAGPQIATGVVITDWLPVGLIDVTWVSSGAAVVEIGDLVWDVADLAIGEGGVITITGTILPELSTPATLQNIAVISGAEIESDLSNNVDVSEVLVLGYGVDLQASAALTGTADSTVTYTLAITNTGSLDDSYDLAATSIWLTIVSPTEVTLLAGASTSITVTVAIPAAVADGAVDVATVTAVSQSSVATSAAVQLTTTAVVDDEEEEDPNFYIYLPFIIK